MTDPLTSNEVAVELRRNNSEGDQYGFYDVPPSKLQLRAADEIDRLETLVAELTRQKAGYRGAVERLNAALDRRQKPERPFGWYRELPTTGVTLFHRGNWPPPEPDDTAWYPLYSTPEGRPAVETTVRCGALGHQILGTCPVCGQTQVDTL